VITAFMASFILTVLIFAMAFFVRDPEEWPPVKSSTPPSTSSIT
jgi:hypothetical protein